MRFFKFYVECNTTPSIPFQPSKYQYIFVWNACWIQIQGFLYLGSLIHVNVYNSFGTHTRPDDGDGRLALFIRIVSLQCFEKVQFVWINVWMYLYVYMFHNGSMEIINNYNDTIYHCYLLLLLQASGKKRRKVCKRFKYPKIP